MKRECDKFAGELSALIDGELAAERRAQVEAHAAGCADCRQRVAELRRVAAGVAALPEAQPAPQFLAEVRRKIRAGDEPKVTWADVLFRPLWLKVPLEALATLAILVGALALIRPVRREGPVMEAARDRKVVQESPAQSMPAMNVPAPVLPQQEPPRKDESLVAGNREVANAPVATAVRAPAPAASQAEPVRKVETAVADLAVPAEAEARRYDADKLEVAKSTLDYARATGVVREQIVVVDGRSLSEVRQRAEQVALSVNGQVLDAPLSNAFLVSVPATEVKAFTGLLQQRAELAQAAEKLVRTTAVGQSKAKGGETGPATVLEIVVPPAP